ncbi:hypothetical protein SLA2020_388610 [Shorea laevis]
MEAPHMFVLIVDVEAHPMVLVVGHISPPLVLVSHASPVKFATSQTHDILGLIKPSALSPHRILRTFYSSPSLPTNENWYPNTGRLKDGGLVSPTAQWPQTSQHTHPQCRGSLSLSLLCTSDITIGDG